MYEDLSVAQLDALVAAGRISLDDYWRARVAIDRRLEDEAHEHAFDLPQASEPNEGHWVSPPPGPRRPPPQALPPPELIPPPPPNPGHPPAWVQLPIAGPSADAASTRADDRPKKRRRRSR